MRKLAFISILLITMGTITSCKMGNIIDNVPVKLQTPSPQAVNTVTANSFSPTDDQDIKELDQLFNQMGSDDVSDRVLNELPTN
ncbi:MAG: hypothetical protein WCP97_06315 [bacterium]